MKQLLIFSSMIMFVLLTAVRAHAEEGPALKVISKTHSNKSLNKTKKNQKTKKNEEQYNPFVVPLSSEAFHGLSPSEAAEKELRRSSSGAINEE